LNATIISALISAGAAIMVCLVNNHFIRKESDRKQEQSIVLISYRLEQLEQKVDRHNNLVERTYELEKQQAQTDEKVKVINHRIADLEGKGAQA
jgi:TolA-binding protein